MILTNCWKIYESLYDFFLSPTQKRRSEAHREFLETLVKLLFFYNFKKYAEIAPKTFFKKYSKYSYTSYKADRKSQYSE
jgi:hypothetical protein